jgi:negative regulator of sigma E activity
MGTSIIFFTPDCIVHCENAHKKKNFTISFVYVSINDINAHENAINHTRMKNTSIP